MNSVYNYDNNFINFESTSIGESELFYKAMFKEYNKFTILKPVIISQQFPLEKFIEELNRHQKIKSHNNILKIYGLTKPVSIVNGKRELEIIGTPLEYSSMYKVVECLNELEMESMSETTDSYVDLDLKTTDSCVDNDLETTYSCVGIDIGTSYSCVGTWKDEHIQIITNDRGNRITPSYIAFTDHGRLIGDSAKSQISRNPYNTIYNFKRIVGHDFHEPAVQNSLKHWPFKVVDKNDSPHIQINEMGVTKYFTPEEIYLMMLIKMKQFVSSQVDKVVVAIPTCYNLAQYRAIVNAGYAAGLNTIAINDTSASAIAYWMSHKLEHDHNVLIVDLGSGNLSVSLITLEMGIIEVKAVAWNSYLGGEDFDNRIVDHYVKEFKLKFKKDLTSNARSMSRLRAACERAKCTLSVSTQANIEVDSLFNDIDFYTVLTRSRFEELNKDLFHSILEPIEKVFIDANIDKTQVHEIILAGGSTRIPMVQKIISDSFNGKKLNKSINPDEAIAFGASVYAAMIFDDVKEKYQNLLLLDVISLSLGIESDNGIMIPIVKRNSTIPIKKTEIISTCYNSQPGLFIKVYEGEQDLTKDNNFLGKFVFNNIPPAPRGSPQIEITFDIDIRKNLTIFVVDKTTKLSKKIIINDGENNKEQILFEETKGW
ncbi:2237_t:CDS:2, partial [Scutellospora calospora]